MKSPFKQLITVLPGFAVAVLAFAVNLGISSCNNNNNSGDSSSVVSEGSVSKEDMMKIVEGGWVNVDYEDALLRVHSPMFAAEAGRPVQEMLFEIEKMNGDTLFNTSGRLNYLQGERFDIIFAVENGKNVMNVYEGTASSDPAVLTYKITGADTMLCLVRKTSNDSVWYKREFHKAPIKAGIAQNALEHFVNRSLFEGEWKGSDGSDVTFSADGKVTGWAKWTWFSVEIDKYGNEIQPDVMSAYNDKMGATYVYTLDNGRLSVYEYDSSSEDGMWTRGKLVAEFTKK